MSEMLNIPAYCRSLDTMLTPTEFANVLGGNWMSLVFTAILAMIFFLVLAFFASRFFRIPKLEAWSRFELFQMAANAVLIIMLAGWMYGMCSFDVAFLYNWAEGGDASARILEINEDCFEMYEYAGGDKVTPFCASQSYLKRVKARGDDVYQVMVGVGYILSYMFKLTWNSHPIGIGYSLEPLAGFQQIMNIYLVAVSGFILSYLSVLVQMRILDFFMISMPYYFIPLGLLLRCFEPTREFGGSVLGFGFASLLFFPLIIMMNDFIVYSSFEEATKKAHELRDEFNADNMGRINAPDDAQGFSDEFNNYEPGANDAGMLERKEPDESVENAAKFFTEADPDDKQQIVSGETYKIGQTIFFPYQVLLVYVVAAVVLPIINLMIYIEVARQLTHFLGTQMDLTNLTRMI
ncbi:MAG: hypothetical protein ABIH83_03975 [Candidatus Micrarchaeota archaeon]